MWCLPVNSASLERHGAIVDILLVEAGNIFTVIKRKNMCVCVYFRSDGINVHTHELKAREY